MSRNCDDITGVVPWDYPRRHTCPNCDTAGPHPVTFDAGVRVSRCRNCGEDIEAMMKVAQEIDARNSTIDEWIAAYRDQRQNRR